MRSLAAILIVVAWPIACAQLTKLLQSELARNAVQCSHSLGPSKCLAALGAWRAQNAINDLEKRTPTQFNLTADVERFPWKRYSDSTDEQLYSQLCDGTQRLLQYQPLMLSLPGYKFELESNGNGTLKLDVIGSSDTARGMKKLKKQFLSIVPILLVPGLIMSAILPFVLPALKMMTVAVGMLNNMALTGAIFTLLRNNAFNDKYENKVVYLNAGYKNEKQKHDDYDYKHNGAITVHEDDHDFDEDAKLGSHIIDFPVNNKWVGHYHAGDGEFIKVEDDDGYKENGEFEEIRERKRVKRRKNGNGRLKQ